MDASRLCVSITPFWRRFPLIHAALALDVHVVTHTHWDREWYHPVARFRQRLVALVDELLDALPASDESFLLDGQAIVLDDYLSVRPERADDLAALLRAGRIEAGPWFVLADELIPSGEALVRNLLTGRRVLARFGAAPPPVLYCPDSFGHPGTLPSIAAGFGLPLIVLWRGYGSARWPRLDTAEWKSPSGDEVVLFHLPRSGYEFGSHLPADAGAAAARWSEMRSELAPRSATGVLLVANGADHHAPQRNLHAAIASLELAGVAENVHRSSLRAFAEQLVHRAAAERASLPRVQGELRDSYGYTWTLQGTFATRAHEKRLNATAERLLVREAEPWAALAARAGHSRRRLLEAAWRTLLEAHPHDTLCGCSIDDVAAAMELRVRSAANQADGVRDDAIVELLGHDPVEARAAHDRWIPLAVVRNPAARLRSGVAIIDVEQFIAHVPVGPGSAPEPDYAPRVEARRASMRAPAIEGAGRLQVLSSGVANSLIESPRHYPDNDLVMRTRVAAWIGHLPGYAIAGLPIDSAIKSSRRPKLPVPPVKTDGRSMDNAILRVSIGESGAVTLEHLETGRRIDSLLLLEDDSDVGDSYTPAPRPRAFAVDTRRIRRVHRGPLRGEFVLELRVSHGKRLVADLTVLLTLDAGAQFLRIAINGENRDTNHRLRFGLRTGVAAPQVWADAAFGPVLREPIAAEPSEAVVEQPPPTAPLHRYVSLFGDAGGATIFSDGLAEYEARADGTVRVTLVRAIGELSRNDLPERPGHAGWPRDIPAAQCLGPFASELAILLHGPRTAETIDAVERTADDVLLPLVGTTLRSALRVPAATRGVELEGTGLGFSAAKESEDGEWLVLRCVNLTDEHVSGAWRLPFTPREARLSRFDETSISKVATEGDRLPFEAPPRAIVSFLVR
jgi:alpha-mannosidase